MIVGKHIIFSGRVQGVGFRFTGHRVAVRYGLTGFVRNLSDGAVEMLIQGPSQDVDGCIAEIKDCFAGYVRGVQTKDVPVDPAHRDFRITY